ncbi:MAG: ABC transporter permease, partial [Planctomycetota bacterium]
LLVVREIRIRYARAFLGMAWALFIPLIMMLVFSALNFGRLVDPESPFAAIPYSTFAYCGLLFWTHFATSLTTGTNSLVTAAPLIKKCSFPREVIPLSKVLAPILDLLVGAVFLIILLVWHGLTPGWSLVLVPFIFALQLVFTSGVVLVLSAANMYFRDVNYLTQVGVMLLMFATSVIYPVTPPGTVAKVVLGLNPMSAYLNAYREILLLGQWPGPQLIVGVVGAFVSIAIGAMLFKRLSPHFAEEV